MSIHTWFRRAALVGLSCLLAACAASAPSGSTRRDTAFGPVVGADDSAASGTLFWKGVPFAQPPVGAMRWRAPVDPAHWTAPRNTKTFAQARVQNGRLYGPGRHNRYDETIGATLGQPLGSEDCLYLNIWAPAKPSAAPRPVIVFVHGGSFITGYTADPVYDGAALARSQDAVVVTVNYRLGIFGYLNLPALKTGRREDDSGNFALLDIVKALEFLQGNIAAFGGDPNRVTLMGQSAGAVNVYALLTSPMLVQRPGPKLFHRLVPLSGGISTPATLPKGGIAGVQPLGVWEKRGEGLLTEALIAAGRAPDEAAAHRLVTERGPAEMAGWLRQQPPEALLHVVLSRLAKRGMAASNVIPDGWVSATDPIAAMRAGQYVHVPVLAGHARDETKLFPQLFAIRPDLGGVSGRLLDDAAVFALVSHYDPEAPPATTIEQWVPPVYLPVDKPVTGFNARAAELDRVWFAAIRDDALNALRSQQRDVWAYEFEWDAMPPPFDVLYGAAHAFDLPFVFGNFGPSLYSRIMVTRANAPGRFALSKAMMDSLGAFARSGDPDNASLATHWKPWPAELVFDADATSLHIGTRERVQR